MNHAADSLPDTHLNLLLSHLDLPEVPSDSTPPVDVTSDPDWRADLWLLSQQLERGC